MSAGCAIWIIFSEGSKVPMIPCLADDGGQDVAFTTHHLECLRKLLFDEQEPLIVFTLVHEHFLMADGLPIFFDRLRLVSWIADVVDQTFSA